VRKLLLSVVLPLLLLLSQQGAAWHEIGHLHEPPASSSDSKKSPGDKLCDTCLAFAHLACGAGKPDVARLWLPHFSHDLPAAVAVASTDADAPHQRSRGPPHLL
jgi:hypothetical protein